MLRQCHHGVTLGCYVIAGTAKDFWSLVPLGPAGNGMSSVMSEQWPHRYPPAPDYVPLARSYDDENIFDSALQDDTRHPLSYSSSRKWSEVPTVHIAFWLAAAGGVGLIVLGLM